MDITPQLQEGRVVIKSYGVKGFEIGEGNFYESSILISNDITQINADSIDSIKYQDIELKSETEIFVIGTGSQFLPVKKDLKDYFASKRIAIEFMDTGAACRTYNILAQEGRNVAALLLRL